MVASIDLKILLRLRPCLMRGHWLLRIIHVLPYTLTHSYTWIHTVLHLHVVSMLPEYIRGTIDACVCCMCMRLQEYAHGITYAYF